MGNEHNGSLPARLHTCQIFSNILSLSPGVFRFHFLSLFRNGSGMADAIALVGPREATPGFQMHPCSLDQELMERDRPLAEADCFSFFHSFSKRRESLPHPLNMHTPLFSSTGRQGEASSVSNVRGVERSTVFLSISTFHRLGLK